MIAIVVISVMRRTTTHTAPARIVIRNAGRVFATRIMIVRVAPSIIILVIVISTITTITRSVTTIRFHGILFHKRTTTIVVIIATTSSVIVVVALLLLMVVIVAIASAATSRRDVSRWRLLLWGLFFAAHITIQNAHKVGSKVSNRRALDGRKFVDGTQGVHFG